MVAIGTIGTVMAERIRGRPLVGRMKDLADDIWSSVRPGFPDRMARSAVDAESGFTKLLDLCKCTDRGSMGIEHKDWLLSTL
ncbi:unnamed protein product [Microthlaspi erraticum]|uniref:Uncharacterized protein n=1 Tax=Microthlaspi erraticum TaxID=1685480 RepID=A0A6D2JL17_9BRAS|nr:unnamed protein product [Microthlaspi erraticum]